MRRSIAAVIAAAFLAAGATGPGLAQSTQKPEAKPRAGSSEAKPARKISSGLAAARARQKKCGAEWREAKAAGKIEKGMKWPKYWSACNKRLKEAGA